jgi:hypothetical protein
VAMLPISTIAFSALGMIISFRPIERHIQLHKFAPLDS